MYAGHKFVDYLFVQFFFHQSKELRDDVCVKEYPLHLYFSVRYS